MFYWESTEMGQAKSWTNNRIEPISVLDCVGINHHLIVSSVLFTSIEGLCPFLYPNNELLACEWKTPLGSCARAWNFSVFPLSRKWSDHRTLQLCAHSARKCTTTRNHMEPAENASGHVCGLEESCVIALSFEKCYKSHLRFKLTVIL